MSDITRMPASCNVRAIVPAREVSRTPAAVRLRCQTQKRDAMSYVSNRRREMKRYADDFNRLCTYLNPDGGVDEVKHSRLDEGAGCCPAVALLL